jgi:hypothetical protein
MCPSRSSTLTRGGTTAHQPRAPPRPERDHGAGRRPRNPARGHRRLSRRCVRGRLRGAARGAGPGRRPEVGPGSLPVGASRVVQVDDGPDTGVMRSPPPRLGHEARVSRPDQRATVGHAGVACWQAAQVPGVEEPLPGHHSAGPHFLDAPDLGWSTARRASKYQVATKGPVSPSRTSARVAPDRSPARMNRAPARTAAAARPRMQASGWRSLTSSQAPMPPSGSAYRPI